MQPGFNPNRPEVATSTTNETARAWWHQPVVAMQPVDTQNDGGDTDDTDRQHGGGRSTEDETWG